MNTSLNESLQSKSIAAGILTCIYEYRYIHTNMYTLSNIRSTRTYWLYMKKKSHLLFKRNAIKMCAEGAAYVNADKGKYILATSVLTYMY